MRNLMNDTMIVTYPSQDLSVHRRSLREGRKRSMLDGLRGAKSRG
jgi:hypothetical protein